MTKPGDTVRYLNEVGGGVVTRVEGKIAYVNDDGFERPVALNELVVVIPAGHAQTGAKLMFDQQAYDIGRTNKRNKTEESKQPAGAQSQKPVSAPEPEDFPIEETDYGDAMNVVMAFEPKDARKLDTTTFNVALVNDSNYFLSYQLLVTGKNPGEWSTMARGEVAPNEIADLRTLEHDDIPGMARIVFQAIAYKKDKDFTVKEPLNALRKLDLTKFFKFHCFRPGLYFETPVLEVPLFSEAIRKKKK